MRLEAPLIIFERPIKFKRDIDNLMSQLGDWQWCKKDLKLIKLQNSSELISKSKN